jgi:hypothetical protein
LTVTFDLSVYNLANQTIQIGLWFQDANGNGILHSGVGQNYRDSNGHLTYQTEELVLYDASAFSGYTIFVPFDQSPLTPLRFIPFSTSLQRAVDPRLPG